VILNSKTVKEIAFKIGFDSCGISDINVEKKNLDFFNYWLKKGYNAEMHYLRKYYNIREDPELLVESAKSVISVILNYYSSEKLTDPSISISKYAYGMNYHAVIKNKLFLFLNEIRNIDVTVNGRVFVDTAPIFERYFAERSGLGFIGKNNCIINENFGSWIFIGEIIIDKELEYDLPLNTGCGSCTACIDCCPTEALSGDGLNANKCISYHTIENRGEVPRDVREKITTQVFGCDICQNVCPYNRKPVEHDHSELDILPQIKNINFDILAFMSDAEFNKYFSETSLNRAGRKKLLDNFNNINIQNAIKK